MGHLILKALWKKLKELTACTKNHQLFHRHTSDSSGFHGSLLQHHRHHLKWNMRNSKEHAHVKKFVICPSHGTGLAAHVGVARRMQPAHHCSKACPHAWTSLRTAAPQHKWTRLVARHPEARRWLECTLLLWNTLFHCYRSFAGRKRVGQLRKISHGSLPGHCGPVPGRWLNASVR